MARVLAITLNPALDLSIGLDTLMPGTVHRAGEARSTPAGKGNNVARVLAAHGHQVTVSGFLGAANAGVFETAFADWGVADAFIRVAGETRTNVKLAESAGRVTDINTAGAAVADDDWAGLLAEIDSQAETQSFSAAVIAGSLPPGVAPARLAELVVRLNEFGVPVWLDTSGEALAAAIAACPAWVKPNVDELAAWAGRTLAEEATVLDAAAALQQAGVTNVVVSRGAAGVFWQGERQTLAATAPRVSVVSTVCAGDTLVAGLMHGRLSGWSDDDTLAFAVALSADAVTRIGVGRSDTAEFETLRQSVAVQAVVERGPRVKRGSLSAAGENRT
ncbi:1-phosphofructokinase [Salinisphaera sp. SPP-AMP-43]|uniref:1-phosphofructokinase n=1 Tax=Salinisphaera sp. SPP-AMP-43 TaxID=3121288 RepID=UPI003C6E3E82